MCLKNKIVAAALCALIAGVGIFGIQGNIANAQTSGSTMTLDQMQQIVTSLKNQIQQLIQMLAARNTNSKTCEPKSCVSMDYDCGSGNDGCGNTLNCGICPTGKTCTLGKCVANSTATGCGNGICDSGETTATCAGDCPANSCTSKTCISLNLKCGTVSDGCNGTLNCGACASGKTCVSGSCQNATTTCAAIGASCSQSKSTSIFSLFNRATPSLTCCEGSTCKSGKCVVSTGCGNGTCETGETPETCAADCNCAAKKTCAGLNYACGTPSNGCGGKLDCGQCAFGKTCIAGKCETTVTGADGKECFTLNNCSNGGISCPKLRCVINCSDGDSGKYPNWVSSSMKQTNGVATYCGVPTNPATYVDPNDPNDNCDMHETCTKCSCPAGYATAADSPIGTAHPTSLKVTCTVSCKNCCEEKTGGAPNSINCTDHTRDSTITCYKKADSGTTTTKKSNGSTCTVNSDCASGICKSGQITGYMIVGDAKHCSAN